MIKPCRARALRALIPPPRQNLSAWIEREVKLADTVSALPGPIRLYAFQRGIADAISDSAFERVTVIKSARIGYTTLLVGALASHVVNDPAPVLFVLPTDDDCRKFIVGNVEPTFEASPALAGALSGDLRGKRNRNTILSRRFPGGSLQIVAAKAPRNLRAHNTRILFIDEADAMEVTADGSPIALAETRTMSFPDRKIVLGSTPLFEETSHVIRAYAKSDQRIFEVPCPACGVFHEIKWDDIRWPEGEPEKAHWRCPSCKEPIDEKHKYVMVEQGQWSATRPEVKGHAGFRINALVSPLANAAWGKLAVEFLEAKGDPSTWQPFVNNVLGQRWSLRGEEIDETTLAARAERFDLNAIPAAVLAMTAGFDVQRDRLEITIIGWSANGTAYVLGHDVIWGVPDDDHTWRELDELLTSRFVHPLGGKIGLDAVAIDSGDGETMEAVYRFAFPRTRRRVMAIKGMYGTRPWIQRSKSKVQGGWLWIVGVDGLKSHLRARVDKNGDTLRFSDSLPPSWYEQFTAERVVIRYVHGQPVRRFERIPGKQAEALDCTVYAFAARNQVSVNWSAREDQLRNPEAARPVERPRTIKSLWMERL